MKKGKRIRGIKEKIDPQKEYSFTDALVFLKENHKIKFDESVDMDIRLGVDPKQSDQMVRGTVILPHGTGKKIRVLAFAKGDKLDEARSAGADYAGLEDLAQKIQGGWVDFDATVATPDCMSVVGKLGKILGPRGLMPNPKLGNVTMDVARVVKELKAGKVEYRIDKYGIIHTIIGKISFNVEKLEENGRTLVDAVLKARPSSTKGTYIKKISVSTTMGPGQKIDKNSIIE
jgi:large subunit ribosomal protein L1